MIPRKAAYCSRGDPVVRELLSDVTDGKTDHKAILVHDVRRWGRFRDTDEAAHYEFVCKIGGHPGSLLRGDIRQRRKLAEFDNVGL